MLHRDGLEQELDVRGNEWVVKEFASWRRGHGFLHHTKAFLAEYEQGLRVIVHSANLDSVSSGVLFSSFVHSHLLLF